MNLVVAADSPIVVDETSKLDETPSDVFEPPSMVMLDSVVSGALNVVVVIVINADVKEEVRAGLVLVTIEAYGEAIRVPVMSIVDSTLNEAESDVSDASNVV